MSETGQPPSTSNRQTRLVIGNVSLAGPAAAIVTALLSALLVWLVVISRPTIGMLLAAGVWLGFLVFWSRTAGRAGAGCREESRQSRALHQKLLNLGLLLLFVSIPGLRWPFMPANAWHVPVGLAIMVAGTLLHIHARLHLGRNWSSKVMIKGDHQLVRSGAYRFIRHPIYTAIVMVALGTAVVSGRVLSLIGVAVFAFAYVRKLQIEERMLGEEFGAEWQDYRAHSWALVPLVF
jgi:protein-S-isoprenylcysteine O-methyltransferase Ste14